MIRIFPIPKGNEMLYIIIHEDANLKQHGFTLSIVLISSSHEFCFYHKVHTLAHIFFFKTSPIITSLT